MESWLEDVFLTIRNPTVHTGSTYMLGGISVHFGLGFPYVVPICSKGQQKKKRDMRKTYKQNEKVEGALLSSSVTSLMEKAAGDVTPSEFMSPRREREI